MKTWGSSMKVYNQEPSCEERLSKEKGVSQVKKLTKETWLWLMNAPSNILGLSSACKFHIIEIP